jgi:predicted nucleotidyltransferase
MKENEYGLLDAELAEIVAVIRSRVSVESAVIYGSRAKGNYRPGSDVDLALKGQAVRHEDLLEVGYSLNEEKILPYQFDIIGYDMIENNALQEHIDRVGREIFRRAI